MTYEFTAYDLAVAEGLASIDYQNFKSRSTQVEWNNYDWRDGILGELAFSRWTGKPMRGRKLGERGDNGIDFPESIDVKATANPKAWTGCHLMRPVYMPLKAEQYVMVVLSPGHRMARLAGWATRDELLAARVLVPGGKPKVYVPTRAIHEDALHKGLPS